MSHRAQSESRKELGLSFLSSGAHDQTCSLIDQHPIRAPPFSTLLREFRGEQQKNSSDYCWNREKPLPELFLSPHLQRIRMDGELYQPG